MLKNLYGGKVFFIRLYGIVFLKKFFFLIFAFAPGTMVGILEVKNLAHRIPRFSQNRRIMFYVFHKFLQIDRIWRFWLNRIRWLWLNHGILWTKFLTSKIPTVVPGAKTKKCFKQTTVISRMKKPFLSYKLFKHYLFLKRLLSHLRPRSRSGSNAKISH